MRPIPRGASSEIEEEESDAFKDDIRGPSPLRSDDELFKHASAPSSGPVAPKKRGRKAKAKAKKGVLGRKATRQIEEKIHRSAILIKMIQQFKTARAR